MVDKPLRRALEFVRDVLARAAPAARVRVDRARRLPGSRPAGLLVWSDAMYELSGAGQR